jgi:PIN domain nuclease of toxin-antitoxin system
MGATQLQLLRGTFLLVVVELLEGQLRGRGVLDQAAITTLTVAMVMGKLTLAAALVVEARGQME